MPEKRLGHVGFDGSWEMACVALTLYKQLGDSFAVVL